MAQTEARTASDNAASLQRSSEATTAELSTAQASLEESKEESKELRDALDKMREELAATYARAHSAEVSCPVLNLLLFLLYRTGNVTSTRHATAFIFYLFLLFTRVLSSLL